MISGALKRRYRWLMLVVVGLVLAVCSSVSAERLKTTWLFVEFSGSGNGVAGHATGSGGKVKMSADWTFLYKLPAEVIGKTWAIECTDSSCGGHDYPYAAEGKGTGSISGSSNPGSNCNTKIQAQKRDIAGLSYLKTDKFISVETISPMRAGFELASTNPNCTVYGGDFPDRSGKGIGLNAQTDRFHAAALAEHQGEVFSTPVSGHGSAPDDGTIGTPEQVSWSGYMSIKLGGCEPRQDDLARCFPAPNHRS